ncbi:LamG domain-containing protein [Gaoshiqia sp. Z1-71]|uniref:LamG domain-containing protein n=1 Tax=Gaoshiqia hydrogeniformans TaxID=3290090 RepID=UPI003BF8955C
MKKNILFLILGLAFAFPACDFDDQQPVDARLSGLEMTFNHTNPRTGEVKTNEFSDYFRKTDEVKINIECNLVIQKIDIINSVSKTVLSSLVVNDKEASFSCLVDDLDIPFGQSTKLLFHVYFDDAGVDGIGYQSIKSYAFTVISDIPSIVSFRKSDGSVVELKTKDVNIEGFSEDDNRGIVASFKGGQNSFLEVENSSLLNFGANQNFSISFWMQSGHNISDPALMGTMDWNSSNNPGWVLAWLNGRLRFVAGNGEGSKTDFRMDDTTNPLLGTEWHFVTCVLNRTGYAEIYVDGALQASAIMNAADINNGVTVKINQDGTGSYGDKLLAKYSDVIFYNYALTNAEITAMYNAGK